MSEAPSPERQRMLAGIRGEGIEIGAFHSPLPVGPGTKVLYVDQYPTRVARLLFPEVPESIPIVEPDLLSPADDLAVLGDSSQDFVLASHLLEHVADPIAALKEWHRVLKPHGRLFLCLPDKRNTFDRTRQRTTLDHHVLDHREGPESPSRKARDLEHFREWARAVNGLTDPRQVELWADLNRRVGYPIHYHCWIAEDVSALIGHVGKHEGAPFSVLELAERADGYEFTFLLEKVSPAAGP